MARIKKIFLICFFTLLLYGCGGASDDTVKHEAGKTEIKTEDVKENVAANEETERETVKESANAAEETGTIAESTATEEKKSNTQEITTKKEQQTTQKKKEAATKKEVDYTDEYTGVNSDGSIRIWQYRSEIYADNTEEGQLEDLFWNLYGWTTFTKKQNDEMVVAMIELVMDVKKKYATDFEREKAIYKYICLNCRYDHESLETGLTQAGQTPYGVLIEHKAVCGGYAKTFNMAMELLGIECEYVMGSVKTSSQLHGWNHVCLDGEWYAVDVTWGDNDAGGEGDEFGYGYFNITTEEMSKDHYERGKVCNGTKYGPQYIAELAYQEYIEKEAHCENLEEATAYIQEQIQKNNRKIKIYSSSNVQKELLELFSGENRLGYVLTDDKNNDYFYYEVPCIDTSSTIRYKYSYIPVYETIIELEPLGYYTELDNYFEDEALMYDYVNNMILNGETTIEVYMHGYEEFYIDSQKLAHFNLCAIDKMGCNKNLYQITFEIFR